MPIITFPDGSNRFYQDKISILDIARDISSELSEICVAGRVNGKLVDAVDVIHENSILSIVTSTDEDSLEIIRRTCSHLLARAIKKLWPDARMAMGKTIENGFYYDIDLNFTLTTKDLNLVEKIMHQLVKSNYSIIKKQYSCKEAINIFKNTGEIYKITLLNEKVKQTDVVNMYFHEEYVDMSRGPHVPSISFCSYFKLQNISGVYWRKNKNHKMLQRIYGTAWANKEQLTNHLQRLEEITKRDHRKIGKELKLYHMQQDSPGMVFWHHCGWIILKELEDFIRNKLKEYHYQEVRTPMMMDKVMWQKTGHWENYKEAIFTTSSENREYCIKPMNCPAHVQIFKQGIKSYRDLPVRIAEFGSCHRNEYSGALHGLMRIREFTQDDAHIFCTNEQIHDEVNNCIVMIYNTYRTFGFKKIFVKLSTRPEKRIGTDELWNLAENSLVTALKTQDISFTVQLGEGAFYGPKIEFILYDCIDRPWQCGTIQLDFFLPQRLNASYIDKNNQSKICVIIHRAILGSLERFIGILTEEFRGIFPCWLAPIQVVVMNIADNQKIYVKNITKILQERGIRAQSDLRNEKISFKIRHYTLSRVPYMLICGNKEIESGTVAVRTRHGKNLGSMNIDVFLEKVQKEIKNRYLDELEE
ncbi:threonine--tRNA ligase [Candidatus Ishikawella capsulata]|uniref:Threonine--tRNA ligase n=1 Tax=Candidatus Ishikawaella capsulata Mpkobe TaxID=476281 RepID=C5WD58_9ENTR|nr:threonine--tRNA ligase [Candidatus Ishikawaella capsulata]BAH83264.1 threonyl-tRNA synthetase [Candidatus Ishikawaella capsulata Mpkobe]